MKELNIGICDDDEIAVGMIQGGIEGIFEKHGISASIGSYRSVRELKYAMQSSVFDLILLDIDLPDMNGIDFGLQLRKGRDQTEIIFVSGCENRVFDSFQVEPVGFVRKSNFLKDLTTYVELFLEKRRNCLKVHDTLSVMHNRQMLLLSVESIIYIEGALKKQRIFVEGSKEEYTMSSSMKIAEKQLLPIGFLRIHSGFLVNYRYILKFEQSKVILKDGKELPVSRNKLHSSREAFFDLVRKDGAFVF